MQRIIISDTSCLIILDKIGETGILKKLYEQISITSTIAQEFGQALPDWISIQDATNKTYENLLQTTVDRGEASAIALAVELDNCLLILDDYKARRLASSLELKFTGTFGLLVEAKLSGHLPSVRPILDKIKQTDFRLSLELERKILDRAGE